MGGNSPLFDSQHAQKAEQAANAANTQVDFYVGNVVVVGNRQRLKPLPESRKGAEAHWLENVLAAVAAAAAVDCHK